MSATLRPHTTEPLPAQSELKERLLVRLIGPAILLALVLIVYGGVLLHPAGRVIGSPGGDVWMHSLWWHDLGWRELAHGHLTLWNPYVYGGSPFLAGFAAMLLYPPSWIGVILPVHVTLNWLFALHVLLGGLFTYAVVRGRGLSRPAAVLGGMMFMLSGPFFLHAYPGHPTAMAAMAWMPLIVFAADRLADSGRWRFAVLAAAAAAMQIYGGQVQYYYFTALAGGVYALLHAIAARGGWGARIKPLVAYAAIYAGSVLLAAPQLFPAFEARTESSRGGGVPIEFAATFSLPPENLATFLSPAIFGSGPEYFGRIYFWEATLFVGVTGLVLAVYSLLGRDPRRRFAAVMALFTLVLALGYHTPLFKPMYHWFPGYDTFRGSSKFTFLTCFFVALLAAVGLDRAAERLPHASRRAVALLGIAAALFVLALALRPDPADPAAGAWAGVLRTIQASGESEAGEVDYADPAFIATSGAAAMDRLLIAAATAAVAALLVWFHSRTRYAGYVLIALCAAELLLFARGNVALTDATPQLPPPWEKLLQPNPGDYRVLLGEERWANWGIVLPKRPDAPDGFLNLYGYDSSSITRRFADFLAFSQGMDPDGAQQYFRFTRFPPQLSMLRCRFVLLPDVNRPWIELKDPLPRAVLVPNYVVAAGRDDVLRRVGETTFNPRNTVVLESEPSPAPQPGGERGTVTVKDISTDELHITADVPAPTILLVTDNYSRLWRATPLSPGPQSSYDVLPANWVLRAIPLEAGRHHIRLRYEPRGLALGVITLALTLAALAAGGIFFHRRRRFASRSA